MIQFQVEFMKAVHLGASGIKFVGVQDILDDQRPLIFYTLRCIRNHPVILSRQTEIASPFFAEA